MNETTHTLNHRTESTSAVTAATSSALPLWQRSAPLDLTAPHQAPGRASAGPINATTLFFLALLLAGSGLVSPAFALLGGVAYGLTVAHPLRKEASATARFLLQLSVVLLGFGIDLHQVIRVGRAGFLYTAVSIGVAAASGLLLGRSLQIGGRVSFLITMGTAICGGSAIAALAPVTKAREEEVSVAMGTVFILNALALLIFPAVGWHLRLSQSQFGLWAALAIHDTSSVVGATARYGAHALQIGTTVKLARALWILPVSVAAALVTSRLGGKQTEAVGRVQVPWFIFFFLLASVASTVLARFAPFYAQCNHLGRLGLTATLFLIGSGLSRKTLQEVGVRPLLHGVLLWALVGSVSLAAVYLHAIAV